MRQPNYSGIKIMKYTHPKVIKDFLFQIDRFINNKTISKSVQNFNSKAHLPSRMAIL